MGFWKATDYARRLRYRSSSSKRVSTSPHNLTELQIRRTPRGLSHGRRSLGRFHPELDDRRYAKDTPHVYPKNVPKCLSFKPRDATSVSRRAYAGSSETYEPTNLWPHTTGGESSMAFIDVTGNVVSSIQRRPTESPSMYVTSLQVPVCGALSRDSHPIRAFTQVSHNTTAHMPACVCAISEPRAIVGALSLSSRLKFSPQFLLKLILGRRSRLGSVLSSSLSTATSRTTWRPSISAWTAA